MSTNTVHPTSLCSQYIQEHPTVKTTLHNHTARLLQLAQNLRQQRIDNLLDLVLLLALLLVVLLLLVVWLLVLAGI
jgi:hypothetical protein